VVTENIIQFGEKTGTNTANIENRKCYVVRKSLIGYTVLSTTDNDLNKRIWILGRDVNFKKLHEMADFMLYPRN